MLAPIEKTRVKKIRANSNTHFKFLSIKLKYCMLQDPSDVAVGLALPDYS